MLTDAFRSGFGVFINGQHAILFPGIVIALSILSMSFIGDGLRDAWTRAGNLELYYPGGSSADGNSSGDR